MSQRLFRLPCECGQFVEVTAAQAGTSRACPACAREIRVPSLHGLHAFAPHEEPAASATAAPMTAAAPTKPRSSWPLLVVTGAVVGIAAAAFWFLRRPPERPPEQRPDQARATPREPAPSRQAPPQPEPPREAQARSEHSRQAPPLLSLDYLAVVDLDALTHSEEPVGAVLANLAGTLRSRSSRHAGAAERVELAGRLHRLQVQFEQTDEQLGDQRWRRLAAQYLRTRVQEQQGLEAVLRETRRDLGRIVELAELFRQPDRVRQASLESLRRRATEQRDAIVQQLAQQGLSEVDRSTLQARHDRLAALLQLPPAEFADGYVAWVFQDQWVADHVGRLKRQYESLQARFAIAAAEAERLLAQDEASFESWLAAQRPLLIRRDLNIIAAMHTELVARRLDMDGQRRLAELCMQWQLEPTAVPDLLARDDAALLSQIDRQGAARMRQELREALAAHQDAANDKRAPQRPPAWQRVAEAYRLEAKVEALQALLDRDAEAQLEYFRSLVPDNWRRGLRRFVELASVVGDAEKLQTAARDDTAREFRVSVESDRAEAETLLQQQQLPDPLRAAVTEDLRELAARLKQDDRTLLEQCVAAFHARLLATSTLELIHERDQLAATYEADADQAKKLLEPDAQQELQQLARAATLRRMRQELPLLAGGAAGSKRGVQARAERANEGTADSQPERSDQRTAQAGAGGGEGLRQRLFDKYRVLGANAGRLLSLADDQLWQWYLNRHAAATQLSDDLVLARWQLLLPTPAQGELAEPLEALGKKEHAEIGSACDSAERQLERAAEATAQMRIPPPAAATGQERVWRGLLQPHLDPMSRYLPQALGDKENPLRAAVESGQDLAGLFPADAPAPAWVGLLRSGQIHALLRRPAENEGAYVELSLFLPASPAELQTPDAAQHAYDRWYVVARLIVRWLLRQQGTNSVRLRAFAYLNDYATCTLWLAADPWQSERTDASPPAGKRPLHLPSWRAFLAHNRLEGLRHDDPGGDPELVLVGEAVPTRAGPRENSDAAESKGAEAASLPASTPESAPARPLNVLGRPVELQDLAVAYRAVFYGGDNQPHQSLDADRHPCVAKANFGGLLEDTAMGKVLLEADLSFKFLTSGLDPYTDGSPDRREDFRRILERRGLTAFEPAYDQFARFSGVAEALQQTRFWLSLRGESGQPGLAFDWRATATEVQVVQPFFVAEARKRDDSGQELPVQNLPPWTRAAIDHFNRQREAYEELYPVLEEVRSVGTLLAFCQWMKDYGLDKTFDLDELLDEPLDPIPTPRARLRGVYANVLDEQGGVVSFNCSEIARSLRSRPLERVSPATFEGFGYMAAASLVLARTWEPHDASFSRIYQGIHAQAVQAMAELDTLPVRQSLRHLEEVRAAFYAVPQRRWVVGCAWLSSGGIDLTLPRPAGARPNLKGKGSSRSSRPAKPAGSPHAARPAAASTTAPQRSAGPDNRPAAAQSSVESRRAKDQAAPASKAPPPAPTKNGKTTSNSEAPVKLQRRGNHARLEKPAAPPAPQ